MPHKIKQTDFHLPKLFSGLKRGPQAMLPKDIGLVIAYSGIGKESIVVDAGAGSAYLALALATTIIFLNTGNLWVCAAVHAILTLALHVRYQEVRNARNSQGSI